MSISSVNDALADVYQSVEKTQKAVTNGTTFLGQLQRTAESADASKKDIYQEYLKQRYGNVMIQNVGKDQKSMDSIGTATAGTGNVVIAPNILEEMVKDPEKAAYYEGQIQHYFQSLPQCKAQLSAMGHEIHSSGIVIHADGTVTHYVSGDLKPEVRAKIEAQMRAEAEEKARKNREYQKCSEEAAREWRQEMERAYQEQSMSKLLTNFMADISGFQSIV